MDRAKIITLANQKGGTGKTTTTYNLATALANENKNVLLVDFDPQGNLTQCFGVEDRDELKVAMADILQGSLLTEGTINVRNHILKNDKLSLLPSNLKLSVAEMNLRNEMGAEMILADVLAPLQSEYDYILIDTNPSLGLLTTNALAACDIVIVPVNPELWAATGLTDLLINVFKAQKRLNPTIRIEGIVLTMCQAHTKLYKKAKQLISDFCESTNGQICLFESQIPRATNVGEANFFSTSIIDFAQDSPAARAYTSLAMEVLSHD